MAGKPESDAPFVSSIMCKGRKTCTYCKCTGKETELGGQFSIVYVCLCKIASMCSHFFFFRLSCSLLANQGTAVTTGFIGFYLLELP